MERNSFCNSLGDHTTGNKAIKDISSNNNNNNDQSSYKVKDSSWSGNNQGCGEDYLAGFSWPPRSYTCSFCKREFRSAQALGGHMNVHRKDRARLRQSPPPRDHHGQHPFLNLNLNPNPNPNISSSSLVSSPLSSTLPSLLVSPPLSSLSSPSSHHFPREMKKWLVNSAFIDPLSSKGSDSTNMMGTKSYFGAQEFKDYGCNNKFLKNKNEIITLDLELEIGLVSDSKEDLDLELRLGYS